MPINKNKVSFTLDLKDRLKNVPARKRLKVNRKIAKLLKDKILDYTAQGKSPVAKGQWKTSLNPKYKAIKKKRTGRSTADLRLSEKMMSSLKSRATKDKVEIKVTGLENVRIASGHNRGDYNGGAKRQFIPNDASGEKFKASIEKEITQIIKQEEVPETDLDLVLLEFAERETRQERNEDDNE